MKTVHEMLEAVCDNAFLEIQREPRKIIDRALEGVTGFHRRVILETLWNEIAKVGYLGPLCVITEMLEFDSDYLSYLAGILGKSRPTLVLSFCEKFDIDPIRHLESLIENLRYEEQMGVTFNSKRFLNILEKQLAGLSQ